VKAEPDPKSRPPLESAVSDSSANDDPGPGEYIVRYEGRSGRLSPNARPDGAEVTTRIASAGPAPALVVWVPSIRVQPGAEVVIHAALLDEQGAPVRPDSIVAVVAQHGGTPGPELAMLPVAAADHQFELRLRAPSRAATFDYAVRARGELHGEAFERAAAGAFHVHVSGGRIDASAARVERRGGNLALLVPANIAVPGTYWMYAELWGGPEGTRPIAFARERFEGMPAGASMPTLLFGGAIIRDSGLDGPYVIRNLRFQQVDAFPPQEQEPVPALPATPAYRASDFF
jgi:hypothetical protein